MPVSSTASFARLLADLHECVQSGLAQLVNTFLIELCQLSQSLAGVAYHLVENGLIVHILVMNDHNCSSCKKFVSLFYSLIGMVSLGGDAYILDCI